MRNRDKAFTALFLFILMLCPGFLSAKDAGESSAALDAAGCAVLVGSVGDGSLETVSGGENDYAAYTVSSAVKAMEAEEILCLSPAEVTGEEAVSPDILKAACLEAGVRWALSIHTEYSGDRFSWRISIYDGEEGAVRASDGFSLFIYTGISSLPVIDNSIETVLQSWRDSFFGMTIHRKRAVTISQHFSSSQDGVAVRFGQDTSGGFIDAGVIEGGELLAPYIPFIEGLPVYGEISRKGYWTKRFTLPNGIVPDTFRLPALQWKIRHSFGFSLDWRGAFPQGIDIEYRFHILPDRLFLRFDWALWTDSAEISGGKNTLHQEFRLSPGVYLLPWTDSLFRLLAGTGFSGVLVRGEFAFLADPLWAAVEFHLPRLLLKAEIRLPWLFGYTRNVFTNLLVDNEISLSAGVMLKW